VGGAVVYDSDAESEYQETSDKAKALIDSLAMMR
jgi:anthranilate/para-aminobenzoate synthase component I